MKAAARQISILALLLAVPVTAAVIYVDPFEWRGPSFLTVCEEAIKDRLRSPGGYVRVSAEKMRPREASLEDVMGWMPGSDQRAYDLDLMARDTNQREIMRLKYEDFKAGQWVHGYRIEYDAPNAYNAPIRGRTECSILTSSKAAPDRWPAWQLLIDGRDPMDEIGEQLREEANMTAYVTDEIEITALRYMATGEWQPPKPPEPPPKPSPAVAPPDAPTGPVLTDEECAWLVDGWNAKKSVEAMNKYGAQAGDLRAQCQERLSK